MQNQITAQRQYRPRDLIREKLIPFSVPTLYRRIAEGSFPRPQHSGPRVAFWTETQIANWQRAQVGSA